MQRDGLRSMQIRAGRQTYPNAHGPGNLEQHRQRCFVVFDSTQYRQHQAADEASAADAWSQMPGDKWASRRTLASDPLDHWPAIIWRSELFWPAGCPNKSNRIVYESNSLRIE